MVWYATRIADMSRWIQYELVCLQSHSVENKRLSAGVLGPYGAVGHFDSMSVLEQAEVGTGPEDSACPPTSGAEPESSGHLQGQSCGMTLRGRIQKVCAEGENQQRSPAGGPVLSPPLMSLRGYTQRKTMN